MPGGRTGGDVDNHADSVADLTGLTGGERDDVATGVGEEVGRAVLGGDCSVINLVGGREDRVGTERAEAWQVVGDSVDGELLCTLDGGGGGGRRSECVVAIGRRVADNLEHVAARQVAADMDGHGLGGGAGGREDAEVGLAWFDDNVERGLAVGGDSAEGRGVAGTRALAGDVTDGGACAVFAGAGVELGTRAKLGLGDKVVRRSRLGGKCCMGVCHDQKGYE